jgi:trehalose 6-phosphate phosphatase
MSAHILNFPALLPPPPPLPITGHALFLDLDGTLAPFADRPDDVGSDPRRTEILTRLGARFEHRLAVVSGRTLTEVTALTEGAVVAAAGVHGLQRRTSWGDEVAFRRDPRLEEARVVFTALAGARAGLLVEDKDVSVALHYRLAPDAEDAVRDAARRLVTATGLVLQEGDHVAELRTAGPDKGDAITAFLGEAPFAGARPIFVGDDVTDEDGFRAAAAAGGFGVLVGAGRATAASYRLDDVAHVLDWLEAATLDGAA